MLIEEKLNLCVIRLPQTLGTDCLFTIVSPLPQYHSKEM